MSFPATTHDMSYNNREFSPLHINGLTVTTHPTTRSYLPDSNGLEMYHVKSIIKNEPVSIQVSAPGWIISTAISLMKFMGKSTGSTVDIKFLP